MTKSINFDSFPAPTEHVPLPDFIKVGAEVQTFRGERGTVTNIREPSYFGASWKVTFRSPDREYVGEYYHTVFEPIE